MALDAEGFIVKTDPYDFGVRMKPAVDGVAYEHPENAHSTVPKRGEYTTARIQPRIHYRSGRFNAFGEYVPDGRGSS
jgi:hypothetical protein